MKKILVSKGYGAGWSSWHGDIPTKFACEYEPIIKALESGDKLSDSHPAVLQYQKDCKEKFNCDYVYMGGLDGLQIEEISDDEGYQIHEYDGAESIVLRSNQEWN